MREVVLLIVALIGLFVAVFAGCVHNPPIPDPPLSQPAPICGTAQPFMWAGSCNGKRTNDSDHYECVICQGERACVDAWTFTYCVGQAACDDPRCISR